MGTEQKGRRARCLHLLFTINLLDERVVCIFRENSQAEMLTFIRACMHIFIAYANVACVLFILLLILTLVYIRGRVYVYVPTSS